MIVKKGEEANRTDEIAGTVAQAKKITGILSLLTLLILARLLASCEDLVCTIVVLSLRGHGPQQCKTPQSPGVGNPEAALPDTHTRLNQFERFVPKL